MRVDSRTKADRNKDLVDYAKNHPDRTLAFVGEIFRKDDGSPLTRQAVGSIIKRWRG